MADGRIFTDYRPNGYVNDLIRMQNGITNSYDYRQFLIHYADDLMNAEKSYLEQKASTNLPPPPEMPIQTECIYDLHSSVCYPVNPAGLGITNRSTATIPVVPYRPRPTRQ
jgi:hypothetical protein